MWNDKICERSGEKCNKTFLSRAVTLFLLVRLRVMPRNNFFNYREIIVIVSGKLMSF